MLIASSMLYTGSDWCCGTERVRLARQARELKASCLTCFTRRGFHYIIFLVAMAMITLEERIDTYKGFNTSKNLIITHAKCFTIDAGMASTRSVHTVRKVTVVTSTSCHSTRRPHRDHCHPGQPYHAHNTLLVG